MSTGHGYCQCGSNSCRTTLKWWEEREIFQCSANSVHDVHCDWNRSVVYLSVSRRCGEVWAPRHDPLEIANRVTLTCRFGSNSRLSSMLFFLPYSIYSYNICCAFSFYVRRCFLTFRERYSPMMKNGYFRCFATLYYSQKQSCVLIISVL